MVLGLVLLAASSALAQARDSTSEAIAGTWTGELLPAGGGAVAVTFVLTSDGKGAVKGTFTGLPSPGDVKKGTFDAKTGALKLELGKADDSAVLLVLEGTVAKGVATGTFDGEMSGTFKLTRKP
jgi:hypothetical protein